MRTRETTGSTDFAFASWKSRSSAQAGQRQTSGASALGRTHTFTFSLAQPAQETLVFFPGRRPQPGHGAPPSVPVHCPPSGARSQIMKQTSHL